MKLLAALLVILIVGLTAQDLFDSAVGAWLAIGALFAIVAAKFIGAFGFWPSDWPDLFGGD